MKIFQSTMGLAVLVALFFVSHGTINHAQACSQYSTVNGDQAFGGTFVDGVCITGTDPNTRFDVEAATIGGDSGADGHGIVISDEVGLVILNVDTETTITTTSNGIHVAGDDREINLTMDGDIIADDVGVWFGDKDQITINGSIVAHTGLSGLNETIINVLGDVHGTRTGIHVGFRSDITVGPGGSVSGVKVGLMTHSGRSNYRGIVNVFGGTVSSSAGNAIESEDNNDILVDADGSVQAALVGIYSQDGNRNIVHGKVHGDRIGIWTGNSSAEVGKTGSVSGETGILMAGGRSLIDFFDLLNKGTVSGTHIGVRSFITGGVEPVRFLFNEGLIEAIGASTPGLGCAGIRSSDAGTNYDFGAWCPTPVAASTVYGVHMDVDPDAAQYAFHALVNMGTIRALSPDDDSYGAVAIHDGGGRAIIANVTGAVIEGDIETGGNHDIIYLMAGSTTDGNIDMGHTPVSFPVDIYTQTPNGTIEEEKPDGIQDFVIGLDNEKILTTKPNLSFVGEPSFALIKDIEATTTIDESGGGTLYEIVPGDDGSVDELWLTDGLAGDFDRNWVNDFNGATMVMDPSNIEFDSTIEGVFNGDVLDAELLIKFGDATWTLGGDVIIDGVVRIDTSLGEGAALPWTQATTVMGGRLNIDGKLTSPNVVVVAGATLGGSGTIVTDPGTPGANGGVFIDGTVCCGEDPLDAYSVIFNPDVDLDEWLAENDLPENFQMEVFFDENGAEIEYGSYEYPQFHSLDATPVQGILAPGNSIGQLNVVGNVYLGDIKTITSTYYVAAPDDRVTQNEGSDVAISPPDGIPDFDDSGVSLGNDANGDPIDLITQYSDPDLVNYSGTNYAVPVGIDEFIIGDDPLTLDVTETQYLDIYDDVPIEGREVVTDWGTVFEAELAENGDHDRLNVTKSGATTAVVGIFHPATEAIPATADTLAVAAVPAKTTYEAVPVPDGVVFLGGRLDIQLEDGDHNGGHVMDIIIAEGGVEGVFQDIGFDGGPNDGAILRGTDLDGNPIRDQVFKGFLEYLDDRVRITSLPEFGTHGETANQISVGNYVDGMSLYGVHQTELQGTLAALGQVGDVPHALDWMSPEIFDVYNSVALALSAGTTDTILDRVFETHRGVAVDLETVGYGTDSSVGSSGSQMGFVFWAGGNWSSADVTSDEGYIEYDYDTLVGYFGVDYLVGSKGMVGLVASFGNTDLDYAGSSASGGDVDNWSISGYGSYFINNSIHVTVGGGHGSLDIETTREGGLGSITNADYDGEYTNFFAEVAATYGLGGNWNLTPSIDFTSTKIKQDEIIETGEGPFALNVDAQSNKSLRGVARVRVTHEWDRDSADILAYVSLGVAHEFKDGLHVLNARFVGDDGNFTVHGASYGGTGALISAGAIMSLNETWAIEAQYNGELSSNYDNHGFSLNVNAAF